MPYQSFEGQVGDSDSIGKLSKLGFPQDFSGKSFLDLGCNEGFFCIEAKNRGAEKVVGIDINIDFIIKARERDNRITYICGDWNELPEEKFDYILFASSMHYITNHKDFFKNIADHLKDDGLFILEAGAIDKSGKFWSMVPRGSRNIYYPTIELLMEDVLSDYAVRWIDNSVNQAGDPVTRRVFHCKKFQPIIVIITGNSGSGKSTLTRELGKNGLNTLSTDFLLGEIATSGYDFGKRPLENLIKKDFRPYSIGNMTNNIVSLGLAKDMATLIFNSLPTNIRIIFVEGYSITPPEILEKFIEISKNNNYKVFVLN